MDKSLNENAIYESSFESKYVEAEKTVRQIHYKNIIYETSFKSKFEEAEKNFWKNHETKDAGT